MCGRQALLGALLVPSLGVGRPECPCRACFCTPPAMLAELFLCAAARSPLLQLCVPEASLVTDQGLEALAGLTALRELDVSCWRVGAMPD